MKTMKPKILEASVIKAVRDYLEIKKICYIRIHPVRPVTRYSRTNVRGIIFVPVSASQLGAPDIIVIRAGVMIALECKSSTGVLSPSQKGWRTRFEKEGGIHEVVRCVDDVIEIFHDIGVQP